MSKEGKEAKGNSLVVKHNSLIEARCRLSVQEQRLIAIMVSDISPDDADFKTYTYKVKDFVDWIKVEGKDYYKELKKITARLLTRLVTIKEGGKKIQTSWLSSATYRKKEGIIELRFDPVLKPYLLQLKECFTKYALKNVLELKSKYAFRLYELLKQYQPIGTRRFSLKELRELLGIEEGELSRWIHFKERVLEISKREINAKTDLKIDYKTEKTGRKITHIVFFVEAKKRQAEEVKQIDSEQPAFDSKELEAKKEEPKKEEHIEHIINICKQYEGKRVKFNGKTGKFVDMGTYFIFILEKNHAVLPFQTIKELIDKGAEIELLE